jgi:exosortase K
VNDYKNILYGLTAIGLFILLKYVFTFSTNDSLAFLLKPTDILISLLTGTKSIYISDKGYYYNSLNITIDKSCSGFNFWLLCFLMLTFLMMKYFTSHSKKMMTVLLALVSSYLFTIFVNTSRIFASIIMKAQGLTFSSTHHSILHEAIGIITNVTFLILAYYITERILNKLHFNAKPAES